MTNAIEMATDDLKWSKVKKRETMLSMTYGYHERKMVCMPCGKPGFKKLHVGKKFSGEAKGAIGISSINKVNSNNSRIYKYSKCVHNTGDWIIWSNLSKFARVRTACIPGVTHAPITRDVLKSYLDNVRVPTGFFTEGSRNSTIIYLHCSACENYINSVGYGVCNQCHKIGKIFTRCCNQYICRVPDKIRRMKPDCK